MAKDKEGRKERPLVLGFLEQISSKVFADFPKQLTDLVGNEHGVYALYKGNRLYYVGLASNLRTRLKQHLRDRHAEKWDKFSVYLVREENHIKELESLILRIADPKGNATKGRLPRAENLHRKLMRHVRSAQEEQIADLIGGRKKRATSAKRKTRSEKASNTPEKELPLTPYAKNGFFFIKQTYKGKTYTASVRQTGQIKLGDKLFDSPSLAAKAVVGGSVNGWRFWLYKNNDGEWVKLNELRMNDK